MMTRSQTAKKILHVFSSLELGGAQRRFLDYIKESEAGFEHLVYAMDGNYAALVQAPMLSPLFGGDTLIKKGNTLKAARACRKLLARMKPDLLVTYNWGAIEWVLGNSLLPICPTVHIQDGFSADEQAEELLKRRIVRGLAYRTCKKVIVPSGTLEKLALASWKIPKKKLLFIPNGIDLSRFTGAADPALLKKYGINPADPIVGTVAGLRLEKNVGRLIEAFSIVEDKLPNAKLVIVGDGVGMAPLRMLADRVCSPGRVIFTGNQPSPEKILPAFNLFSLSSDTEQMPLSVIEAMASGLPIASTDVGDIALMVTVENRPYIAGREAQPLADHIAHLLSCPAEAQKIGTANKEKAQADYALSRMIKTYDMLFTGLCR